MRTLFAFVKKEWMETVRSKRLLILVAVFILFAVINPAITKLTPVLMEEIKASGIVMSGIQVNAMTSWEQFFKNIPVGLIVFVIIYSSSFTKEYRSGTLVLVLTKGLARYKVVIAKYCIMIMMWSICYWLCYGITYGGNAYFWDNSIAYNLGFTAFNWWLFGLWTVTLMVMFSALLQNNIGVLIGTGSTVFVFYLISMFSKVKEYSPTVLMNTASLMSGVSGEELYYKGIFMTAILTVACAAASVPIMNKRRI